jgi:hypothetical protein
VRFLLKDYQQDALGDVLRALDDARDDWQRKGRRAAFSLTATTGAGKTVMAAAAIEALFEGNDEFSFDPDPGAVVLWFTDDPSLNEQTRFRLMEAGDRISSSRLVVIENTFNEERLQPGQVYFLNAQKLSKNSLLVRGALGDDQLFDDTASPDLRAFTFWETLRNTIEDPKTMLYLVLDEAHRGFKDPDRAEKQTVVRRLINGAHGSPPVPIVWGISATVARFEKAMEGAQHHTKYPPVTVDPARVQQSGLLKDDIRLDFPAEVGPFDTVLLARATRKVKDATTAWEAYDASQGVEEDAVVPLLVVQMPNTPSDELLRTTVETIRDAWPELEHDAIAHVFGEHKPLEVGDLTIPYESPEKVQDRRRIRVLLAKDAISTGWDCPRAEVLVSFRPANDDTHITQLLGRMVRTPLARRIPGDDRLNSVECVLPHFNRKTATAVAEILVGARSEGDDGSGNTGGGEGRRVLLAPADMDVNPTIPQPVWDVFDALPSQSLPRKAAKPLKRLTSLAQALSRDGILPDARKDAYAELFSVLDGLAVRHRPAVDASRDEILDVQGETIVATISSDAPTTTETFSEIADERAVEARFRAAARVLSADLARKYADHVAAPIDAYDDGLYDAHLEVAALATIGDVREQLEHAATKLTTSWLTQHRVAIKGLPDERKAVYDDIIAMSADPQRIDIARPRVRAEETKDKDGSDLLTVSGHLMSDPSGAFPVASLNEWEKNVLASEMAQPGFVAWYRNPSRASQDSLAIAYLDGKGAWRRMCPDFVFFHDSPQGVRASIVDPHGFHLADALPKVRGLADYAVQFGSEFHRIEAVARMSDGTLRVLDLQDAGVRAAVQAAGDAEALYLSAVASNY